MKNMDITEESRIGGNLCDYIPENLSLLPFVMFYDLVRFRIKLKSNDEAIKACTKAYEKYKFNVFRSIHGNNWLKRHGYPMKRNVKLRDWTQ